jgi:transposase
MPRQHQHLVDSNPDRLLALLHRWRDEAVKAGDAINRIAMVFEAGRNSFWLARWLTSTRCSR